MIGAPGAIRTRDLCLRRAALYPAELRVLICPNVKLNTALRRVNKCSTACSIFDFAAQGWRETNLGLIWRWLSGWQRFQERAISMEKAVKLKATMAELV
jgi:hypothetical protein